MMQSTTKIHAGEPLKKLHGGDPFPSLTFKTVGGGEYQLPRNDANGFTIALFYRGFW
tara:strand:- start:20752 stop:20922 length:171 start_codon:yes stop_codon:yes gene_type:complete